MGTISVSVEILFVFNPALLFVICLSVDRLNEAGCQWTGQVMVSPVGFGCSLCLALWQSLAASPGKGSTGHVTPLCSVLNNGPCWIMEIRKSQPVNQVRSSTCHDY